MHFLNTIPVADCLDGVSVCHNISL